MIRLKRADQIREFVKKDVSVHDEITIVQIVQISVLIAMNSIKQGKNPSQRVEKIGNADSLKRIQTPVIHLQNNDRSVTFQGSRQPLENVQSKSFHVDFDEINRFLRGLMEAR